MKRSYEVKRPDMFSKKAVLTAKERGDTGKGPLARDCCGNDRSVKPGGKTGRAKG